MNYSVCQACLKRGEDVFPVATEDIECYYRLIEEVSKDTAMFMCLFCTSLLRKLRRFIDQCHNAQILLNKTLDQELQLPSLRLKSSHNLTVSPTTTSYIGPEYLRDLEVDLKTENNSVFDTNEAYITEDEDDVPLVLFSGSNVDSVELFEDMNMKKDISHDMIKKEENLKTELDIKLNETAGTDVRKEKIKANKPKKVLREGFSSRMVQETSEYVVIKLTKEQVLEEMRERSHSDKYLRAPYKCDKCVKGFNFEDVLQSHMDKHSLKNGPLQCDLCAQYCPSAVSLRGHMKSHTTRYKCKICGYVRLSRQHVLEHHTIAHSDASAAYSCEQCVFTTNKRTVMQRHVRLHGRAEPHACHRCGKLYRSLESLRVHTMRHDNKKRFQCDQCNLSFVYPTLLHKHVQSVHIRRDYYCVECDIKFKSMDTLKLHFKRAKRHRDGSSFKCDTRSGRDAHAPHAHAHSCGACARSYGSRAALRAHARRRHSP